MIFDRDVQLRVFPEKFQNDAFDIARIFYGGSIHRQIINGANTIDIISINVSIADSICVFDLLFNPSPGCVHNVDATINLAGGDSLSYTIKITLYRMLKAQAVAERGGEGSVFLPWGALVGIRPVKIYADFLGKGMRESEILTEMARLYDVSDAMSQLCLEIAANQRATILDYNPGADCMLYIGVPFCVTKCAYCSFPSDAHNQAIKYAPGYIDAILKELHYIANHIKGAGRRLRAVYIGGGTPTALAPRELARLLGGYAEAFGEWRPDEITVEAGRADTIDAEKIAIMRGISDITARLRLCINPQSMNLRTLGTIGRAHTPEDVYKAFWSAREAGFSDINMDIIAGLPGEDIDDFLYTLDALSGLRPESITSHTLCLKRSSRINEFYDRYVHTDDATVAAMQDAADKRARQLGMLPYYLYRQKNTIGNLANTGYAAHGHECAYNIHEMADCVDVFAAGAGAVSKFINHKTGGIHRVFNVKNLLEYIYRSDEMINRKHTYLTNSSVR